MPQMFPSAFGALGGFSNYPVLPNSTALQANGLEISLSALGADGMYTVTRTAAAGNVSIGSVASIAGDLLLEFQPVGTITSVMHGFRNAAPLAASSYADADARENMQTDGGSGNPLNTYPWKSGLYQGGVFTRSGGLYMERVGSVWTFSTGSSYYGRKTLFTGTAVDAAARFLALTDFTVAATSFKVRFCAHP